MHNLGSRLRAARIERRLSLRALASSIGVSSSLLSQIEHGKSKPSIDTLHDLARQLGVSLDILVGYRPPKAKTDHSFQPDVDIVIQYSSDAPVLEMENGVRWKRLAAIPGLDIESILVTFLPGASDSIEGKFLQHFGFEYVSMTSGELTLCLEFEEYTIRSGDSLAFDSKRPHLFINRGHEPAQGFWYVYGRKAYSGQAPAFRSFAVTKFSEGLDSTVDVLRSYGES